MRTYIKTAKTGQKIEVIDNRICLDEKTEAWFISTIHKEQLEQANKLLPGAYYRAGPRVLLTKEQGEKAKTAIEAYKAQEENKLKENVPGLDELRAAIEDAERYQAEFELMMEDEQNDGVNPPKPVKTNIGELTKKYPRAALYIKADSYSCAAHYAKSDAGNKAMELIKEGGSLEEAKEILDNWLPKEAIWD